ncbi:hypothetical protein PDTK01_28580 [Phycicoccus sp. DTK01]|nr:hypothetical protein PDTK01_28580 [Phycicoccus sp. DTK01]
MDAQAARPADPCDVAAHVDHVEGHVVQGQPVDGEGALVGRGLVRPAPCVEHGSGAQVETSLRRGRCPDGAEDVGAAPDPDERPGVDERHEGVGVDVEAGGIRAGDDAVLRGGEGQESVGHRPIVPGSSTTPGASSTGPVRRGRRGSASSR